MDIIADRTNATGHEIVFKSNYKLNIFLRQNWNTMRINIFTRYAAEDFGRAGVDLVFFKRTICDQFKYVY